MPDKYFCRKYTQAPLFTAVNTPRDRLRLCVLERLLLDGSNDRWARVFQFVALLRDTSNNVSPSQAAPQPRPQLAWFNCTAHHTNMTSDR